MASTTLRGIVSRLTTPLLPDDYLQLVNALWSARELRGVVVEVVPETEQAATLVIKPGWGWSGQYRAGQYVGIGVQLNGRWHWRSYSLTSIASPDKKLVSITVKAHRRGLGQEHHDRRRHHGVGRRREARHRDAVRMSDGYLSVLCPTAGGPGPGTAR